MSRNESQWAEDPRINEQLSRLLNLDITQIDLIFDVAMEVHHAVPPFDWMKWGKGGDAYKNPSNLREFPIEDLARYLAAMIRLDRMAGEFVLSEVSDEEALMALKTAVALTLNPNDGEDSR